MDVNTLFVKAANLLSLKSAIQHWRYQRITAIILIPLSIWLLLFLNLAMHAPYAETLSWLQSPLNALAILAWTVIVIYHAVLGIQVVIEDYVSNLTTRHLAIFATNLIFLLLGIAALLTIIILLTR